MGEGGAGRKGDTVISKRDVALADMELRSSLGGPEIGDGQAI